jgi:hypothetical protein
VFTHTNGEWSQQAYIKASNTQAGDEFGESVAISGDVLAVGAPKEGSCATGIDGDQTDNNCPSAGAVYVFTRTNGLWSQQAYVKASDTHSSAGLGVAVTLNGDTLAVGTSGTSPRTVYVFNRTAGIWSQQAALIDPALNSGRFGVSLAISGDTLAVGDSESNSCATGIGGDQLNGGCSHAGAVYIYQRLNGGWSQQAYIKASNAETDDRFGSSVALDGDQLAVGAVAEASCAVGVNGDQANNGCGIYSAGGGAVYLFSRTNGSWSQEAYIKASNAPTAKDFGFSLALSGNTLAAGALHEASCATGIDGDQTNSSCFGAGAVYAFSRTNGEWRQEAYVKASSQSTFGQNFGWNVALGEQLMAVGVPLESSCATGINGNQADNNCSVAGATYVFSFQ